MLNKVARTTVMMASAAAMLAGCSKGTGGYSLLDDGSGFKQQATLIPKKIDVLWVVDNSGSMATSQSNLASNFQSFIQRFQNQNYDFHMAVTSTDAWTREFDSNENNNRAKIRDGDGVSHSGVFVINKNTPNINSVFTTNIMQGINGNGDERALESLKRTLMEPSNSVFRRDEAFLAVIIVSDEEDFSHGSSSLNESYSNPTLRSVQSYATFLDTYTNKAVNGKNYSVSAITIPNDACADQLKTSSFRPKIGTRVQQLATLTEGVNGSLCSNFGETLELISDTIILLSSSFKLGREPQEDTIAVTVNGISVPKDAVNGWTYDAASLTITFHGTSVPAANANIQIDFFPKSIKL